MEACDQFFGASVKTWDLLIYPESQEGTSEFLAARRPDNHDNSPCLVGRSAGQKTRKPWQNGARKSSFCYSRQRTVSRRDLAVALELFRRSALLPRTLLCFPSKYVYNLHTSHYPWIVTDSPIELPRISRPHRPCVRSPWKAVPCRK